MKVSIVTSCFNSAETIEDTLQSVINQTYDNIEYVVIDGKSTDDTLAIAYPACFVINREWEIIDWCNHDPNADPVTGYWSHTQILTVEDGIDPVLQVPADITIGSFSAHAEELMLI